MNFVEALNVNVQDIEKPPLPPAGHYIFKVSKQPSFAEVGQQEVYDVVNFQLQAVEALGDVDPEELAAIGGVKSVNLRHNFMFNRGDDPEATAKRNRTLYSM